MPEYERVHQELGWPQQLVYALLLSLLALLVFGYQFPHSNHGQEIPPILALLDPGLYRNDFAVQSFLIPGVRFYYQHLIAFLVGKVHLSLAATYFSLYFISLFSLVLAAQTSAIHIAAIAGARNPGLIYFAAGLLVFWLLLPLHSWGSKIFPAIAIPSVFAMGIAAWGIHGAITKRWILAYGLFGLAALLQFLVGLLAGMVVFSAFLFDVYRNQRWRSAVFSLLLFGSGLALVYVPMALHANPAPADFNFLESFGLYRVPHHWSPSTGSLAEWGSDILLVAGALIIAWRCYRFGSAPVRWLATLCASGIATAGFAVVINSLFVDLWPVTLIGKLQFQRIMPFGHYLIFLLLTFAVVDALQRRRVAAALALVFAPLTRAFGVVVSTLGLASSGRISPAAQAVLLLLAFVAYPLLVFVFTAGATITPGFVETAPKAAIHIVFIAVVGLFAFGMNRRIAMFRRGLPVLVVMISLVAVVVFLSPRLQMVVPGLVSSGKTQSRLLGFLQTRWAYDRTPHLPGSALAQSLLSQSEKDDIVLLPPTWDKFGDTFQLVSRRSVFFAHKSVPYDDYHVWMWTERAKSLLGVDRLKPFMSNEERVMLFSQRAAGEIESLARENNVCFVISRTDWHAFDGEMIAIESIDDTVWGLWKLRDCRS